jgi:Arc/MetJ-type ribon-helix-helix transcriptional regulator
MRNARMTFLLTEQEKTELEAVAGRMGVSSSEYIRLAVDNFEKPTAAEDAELRALATELSAAVPIMQASLNRTNEKMEALHAEMDSFFKSKGLRK